MNQYGTYAELLLSPSEKAQFAQWKELRKDRSITNRLLQPMFKRISFYIPDSVAPNLITLTGLIFILQAWYFCMMFHKDAPQLVSAVAVVCITLYWILHGVDGYHARNIKNDTALGELFKYVADNIACVFMTIVFCGVFGALENIELQWYAVQTGQLVLMFKHHSAFLREAGMRYWFFGPGEVVTAVINVLFVHSVFGIRIFAQWYAYFYIELRLAAQQLMPTLSMPVSPQDPMEMATNSMRFFYYLAYLCMVLSLFSRLYMSNKHVFTRCGLLVVVHCRLLPSILQFSTVGYSYLHASQPKPSEFDVIVDGLFMGVVTSDIIVAKMANRELHSWVIAMTLSVLLPQLQMLSMLFTAFYYICVFGDLSWFMNLSLFSRTQNVYCDGVFDLCHLGHKNLFKAALKNDNRLFVGVCNDDDCGDYKRKPVMTHDERCAEVEACKFVTKVIPNAPCFGLTEEFIKEHRIHVVCCGLEYINKYPDPKDDPYYGVPRQMGIISPLPRTQGLSTSDLIRRIQELPPPDERKDTAASPPTSGRGKEGKK